jgi:hypothetical protein
MTMAMPPISTKQFIWWVILITVGFFLLVLTHGRAGALFNLPLIIASFVVMSPAERKRPLTRNQILLNVGVILASAVLIWWSFRHRTAANDSWWREITETYSRPIYVLPVWIGLVYLGFRRWRAPSPTSTTDSAKP